MSRTATGIPWTTASRWSTSSLSLHKRQPASLNVLAQLLGAGPCPSRPCHSLTRMSFHSSARSHKDDRYSREFLDMIKTRLKNKPDTDAYFRHCKEVPVRQAGVFMPLCVVNGVPSVLFTVRASHMRNHRGEVSFPGGKRDPTDESVLHTALREMQEEIFIDPSVVEVLGEYSPIPNQGCTLKVHPFVGLIKQPIQDIEKDIRFNPDEVQRVFSVPMEHFMDPTKRLMVQFRNSKLLYPTWKIDDPAITIWGLTAFILDGVLRCIAKGGPVDAEEIKEGMDVKQYKPSKPSAFV